MNLLLINGWSASAALWSDFIALLPKHWSVQVLDLDQAGDIECWCSRIDAHLAEPSLILGWSLGGALATEYLARTESPNCLGLITVASNPCFVTRADWPYAMPVEVFAEFSALVEAKDLNALVRRFRFLMTQDRVELSRLKTLYCAETLPTCTALRSGLALLKSLDVRSAWSTLKIPHLHMFGSEDALVPIAVSEQFAANSSLRIQGMGHLPCLSQAPELKDQLLAFAARLV